jgi:hypothetical protein
MKLSQSERHAIPAIYPQREYAIACGLMSYARNSAMRIAWLDSQE